MRIKGEPDLTTEARREEVLTMLLNGATRKEIHAHATKEWKIGRAQIDKFIAAARVTFRKNAAANRREQIGKTLARLEDLYKRNLKVQDYKAAAGILDRLVKLLDLSRQTDAPQSAAELLEAEDTRQPAGRPRPMVT